MPYTNPWTDTDPPGSQNANTIDDELRQLRLDIHERMDDIVADWTADPVVAGAGGAGSGAPIHSWVDFSGTTEIVAAILSASATTTTNTIGVISFNLNTVNAETGQNWQAANLVALGGFSPGILSFSGRVDPEQIPVDIMSVQVSVPANTVLIQVRRQDGGSVVSKGVKMVLALGFTVGP